MNAHATFQPLNRRDWVIAWALAAMVLLAGSWRLIPEICGVYHDDAIYVITGKALAEGEGYRLIHMPGSPPQTKYPILLPALLAIIWRVWPSFPENLLAMKGLCLLSGAGSVSLAYLYVVRFNYATRGVAAAAGLLCATAPLFLYYGSLALSEMPFALLFLMVCWRLERILANPTMTARQAFLFGVLLTLPFWCRTVGIMLVPAGLFAIHRTGMCKRWVTLGALAALWPWFAWMFLGVIIKSHDAVEGYYTDYLGWWSDLGLPCAARIFVCNLWHVVYFTLGLSSEGLTKVVIDLDVRPHLLWAWAGLFAFVPLVRQLWQGRVLPLCLGSYLLLIFFWPWPSDRFLVPILPLLTAYLLSSWYSVAARRISEPWLRRLALAGLAVSVTGNLVLLGRYTHLTQQTGYPYNFLTATPAHWKSYTELFRWIKDHTPTDAVVAADLDPMFYLYADRKGFRPWVARPASMFYGMGGPKLGTHEEFYDALHGRRATHVVVTPMQFFDEPFAQLVQQLKEQYPNLLQEVYRDRSDPRFSIYEVNFPRNPANEPAINGISLSTTTP